MEQRNEPQPERGHCFEPREIIHREAEFGEKAVRLAKLAAHYRVPPFLALHKDTAVILAGVDVDAAKLRAEVAREVTFRIRAKWYAVRSSALSEDGEHSSEAGKYATWLKVFPDQLENAIAGVLRDAREKGFALPDAPFSFFIQEYVGPDHAGVLFTRNPVGGRELVIEWRDEDGSGAVGGNRVNRTLVYFERSDREEPFTTFRELIGAARAIEKDEDAPQDIEWAERNGMLYLVQSRPITTIPPERFAVDRYLDKALQRDGDHYFDQGGIGETFARPTELSRDILYSIYAKSGPIASAYRILGVHYAQKDVFRVFGNALYVDKEKELQQFFPTHSFFGRSELVAHPVRIGGALTTLRNMKRFQTLHRVSSEGIPERFSDHADKALRMFKEQKDFAAWHAAFLHMYRDVFAVNVLAEHLLHTLHREAARLGVSTLALLSEDLPGVRFDGPRTSLLTGMHEWLTGNSLDIADESRFMLRGITAHGRVKSKEGLVGRLATLSPKAQIASLKTIQAARKLEMLREEGRWLSVVYMSGMREALRRMGDAADIPYGLLYFATLDEALHGKFDPGILAQRKGMFESWNAFPLPRRITSVIAPFPEANYGVSPGKATGVLRTNADELAPGDILLAPTLSPDLARHFGIIGGIIAREGGILSHLAIVARESGTPVVVDTRKELETLIGYRVSIDGTTGEIAHQKE